MKTLTIRLTDEQSNMLKNYMNDHCINTASGALLHALESSLAHQKQINKQMAIIANQQSILDGFCSARDAFRSALTYLDQKSLL